MSKTPKHKTSDEPKTVNSMRISEARGISLLKRPLVRKTLKIALLVAVLVMLVLGAMYLNNWRNNNGNNSTAKEDDPAKYACLDTIKESGIYNEIIEKAPTNLLSIERKDKIVQEIVAQQNYSKDLNCLYILTVFSTQLSKLDEAKQYLAQLDAALEFGVEVERYLVSIGGTISDVHLALELVEKQNSESKNNTYYCCDDDPTDPEDVE